MRLLRATLDNPRPVLISAAAAVLLAATVVTAVYLGGETQTRFREITTSWTRYSEDADQKGALISEIRGLLGYGGIIHNFKNYVLRQDDSYLTRLRRQLADFYGVVDGFERMELAEVERNSLREIRRTMETYEAKIPIAITAAAERWPIEKTDKLVKVDDTAAIEALRAIEGYWRQRRQESTREIVGAVHEGDALIAFGYRFLFAFAFVALALYGLFYLLLRELYWTIGRLSRELIERMRAERAENKLSRAVEQSPATIVITDTDGRIEYVNRRFEQVTGYDRDEVLGRTPKFLQSGDTSPEEYAELRRLTGGGEEWRGVFRNVGRNGDSYWAETTILPLKDADGTIRNFIGMGEDVTEKRKARDQVVKAQKMEAVGLLAGGIAHDFNNVLTTILGNAHLAHLDVEPESDVALAVEQIEIAAKRAQALVRQLLTFARRKPAEARRLDLRDAIDEVLRLLRASVPPTIEMTLEAPSRPVAVFADPTHLHQVLLNLSHNAVEAIGGRQGRLCFRLAIAEAPLRADDEKDEPPRVASIAELVVGDTGPGMPPEVVGRVFDPFFTTKPVGKGTGLGLTVVSTLVEEMGGTIGLDSAPGKGTRFTIRLPMVDAPDIDKKQVSEIRGGRERILVVDDEVDIVSVYRRLLMRLGYFVEAYTDPHTALAAFRSDPGRFDIVVSDLVMPDMNGEMIAREIWQVRPDCPVIICTGYRTRSLREWRHGALTVLDKPVDPASLAETIRAMLDAPRTSAGAADDAAPAPDAATAAAD